jgi:hypothetical protein
MKRKKVKHRPDDVVALVLKSHDDWNSCCVTEYLRDGTWVCGMNLITSLAEAVKDAENRGLSIIFEKKLMELKDETKKEGR